MDPVISTSGLTRQEKRVYWQEQVAAWEASHLTQQKFCQKNSVNLVQFIYWRGLLKGKEKKQASVIKKIVPIQVKASPSMMPEFIRIKRPCGLMIELPAMLPLEQLQAILRAVTV